MKIAVDGGALCADKDHRFGNYIVSINLIRSLLAQDKQNQYYLYNFCGLKQNSISNSNNFKLINLQPRIGWSVLALSLAEMLSKKEIFLGLNQAIPFLTRARIFSFSHGLGFYFYPNLYKDSYQRLNYQLKQMITQSERIVVPSVKVKNEIASLKKRVEKKSVVLPYGVPLEMKTAQAANKEQIFLVVAMDHPIKNINFIKKAFGLFHQFSIGKNFRLIIARNFSRQRLLTLYRQAAALLTASLYESFNLPVLEALSQGCPVIGLQSAIIPELQPYVNLARNLDQFINLMEKAANNQLIPTNPQKISDKFNWKNYTGKLVSFY